jgi:phosphoadenosine phosphosulfate reductase
MSTTRVQPEPPATAIQPADAPAGLPTLDLAGINEKLETLSASDIVRFAVETFGDRLMLTTSFGAQAAVMLHLVTQVVPGVPVIFIDTGFHFPETYRFADQLTQRLKLNLKVYGADDTPGWFVARHGELWNTDINRYDLLRKVAPMQRALQELQPLAVLAGLRRQQTDHRASMQHLEIQDQRYKVSPILRWHTRDVHQYLKTHDLPYHPLYEQGYKSIGDWHSTRAIAVGEDERAGRFKGLKQECGLHLPLSPAEDASRQSADL